MPSKKTARALKKKVTPHPPKHARIPKSRNPSPLGTLFILPREVRDEIYSHVSRQGFTSFTDGCRIWEGECLSMLQSKGDFYINGIQFSNKTQRSDVTFVNDVSNNYVPLYLGLMSDEDCWEEGRSRSVVNQILSNKKAEPISFLTGTSIMRNTCTIDLLECTPKALLLLQSPLMKAMSQLIGFKTVYLVFSTEVDYWLENETLVNVRKTFGKLETCPEFDTIVLRISSALERTLGSFTTGGKLDQPTKWIQYVTFHPQSHPTKKVERTKTKSGSQMDEASSALSTLAWTLSILDVEA